MPTLSDFSARAITGTEVPLSDYAGQVVLVVNTASQCGLTPQYAGLEQLWTRYQADGLTVLGFPCDQFGHQEPGDEAEIADFCELNFGVTFPLFAKIEVNGDEAHPLYRWLRTEQPAESGEAVEWNFTKFLVDRDGRVVRRYAPGTTPDEIAGDLEAALAA
ncbi:glutathione peroxidase [Friedmanniella luteola]|uniref:Glutathione peroxidase n=1 Tax=Friedmanniella luteola TaxID=546871 RepID=A0A1H1S6V0_9ACTN|nr:glutathione peroxidase [Friedmanniella luteola]SDS43820.1 glutathione peroxidase [Friedmanniella luteola]